MKFLQAFAIFLTVLFSSTIQAEPTQIRFWIPFAPGGPGDQQYRLIKKYLQEQNPNYNITVEFRGGGGGVIGLNQFVKLDKSEYVEVFLDGFGILINRYLTKTHDVDLNKDVEILMPLGNAQMLVLVPITSDINNFSDLKTNKKASYNYGTSGIGTVSHFTSTYLENFINKPTTHVPYKGSNPVYVDLIAGRLDWFSVFFSSGIEQVNNNRVKAIGISGNSRHPRLPNVKTFDEQGIKNIPTVSWMALFSHPKNDPEKVKKLQQALTKMFLDNSVQQNFRNEGTIIDPESVRNPKAWWDRQLTLIQTLAKDPKFANLEAK